ncbi:MAG TPA: diacylglycerol kinase family protein [Actinomycetes bacterium]
MNQAARRRWAWAALASLLLVVGGLAAVAVLSGGGLLGVVAIAALSVAVVAATGWWAFTTSRVWKRRLNIALAVLAVATVVVGVVAVGLRAVGGVAVVAVGVLGYAAAARRAFGPAARAPGASGEPDPAALPARPWLLVNPGSGGGKAARLGLVAAARDRGVQVHELAPGEDPRVLARQAVAAGADAVGVAGGDGSLGPVAAVAVEADVPFVCVPCGTRNHFAADLGLDRGHPLAALEAFAGTQRRVDVGVVGDRMFMNNVSLGAYADLVAEPGYRAGKLTTAHAVLPGALRGERALLQVAFQDPQGRRYQDVLVLLVANNGYELGGGAVLGAREHLDGGILQISALRARTGAQLAGLAARIAARRVRPGAEWAQWTTTALRVDADLALLPAGIDGEAAELVPPLEFRVLPLALRVLLPPALRPRVARVPLQRWATVRRLWSVATGPRRRWVSRPRP